MNTQHTSRTITLLGGTFLTVCLSLLLAGRSTALAQAAPAEHNHQQEPTVTAAGTVKCTSCSLKKEKDAHAQCSVYGCQFAFKADRVTNAEGKRVNKLEGKTYQIMLNDQSKTLAAKEQKGGRFNLQAKIYADDGVIEVVSFEPDKK